jgi:hypothetical protein
MPNAQPKPILNSALPPQFRQLRIELAREPGHPDGEHGVAYALVAPLAADGRIDPSLWRAHREACRIARLRPGRRDEHGHLIHRQGGGWAFHYDGHALPDDVGFRFADERFVVGEYVSINESGKMHTYRVASVNRL